jgi:hypothetical protein
MSKADNLRTQILSLVREYHAAKFGKMRDCTLFCEAKSGAVPVFSENDGLRLMQNAKKQDPKIAGWSQPGCEKGGKNL